MGTIVCMVVAGSTGEGHQSLKCAAMDGTQQRKVNGAVAMHHSKQSSCQPCVDGSNCRSAHMTFSNVFCCLPFCTMPRAEIGSGKNSIVLWQLLAGSVKKALVGACSKA